MGLRDHNGRVVAHIIQKKWEKCFDITIDDIQERIDEDSKKTRETIEDYHID